MADDFNRGNAAFVDEDFESAVAHYTAAIAKDATNADYFLKRSQAHIKLEDYLDAVADANEATKLAPNNATAFFRKGVALFELEEFHSARAAFEEGQNLDPSFKQFKTWLRKCEAEMAGETGATAMATTTPAATPAAPAPAPVPAVGPVTKAAPPKVAKTEWYQSGTHVIITVFAKGTKRELTKVEFEPKALSISITLPNGNDFVWDMDLCDAIVPEESKFENLSTKVEVRLRKANAVQWASLEAVDSPFATSALPDTSTADKHTYPTSSKSKRNWDKIIKEETEEKEGEGEGDPLNKLFQQIYSNASEETRRAMNKSFVESNGTVLSTNWSEVGAKTVEGSAPQGMEMHSWNE